MFINLNLGQDTRAKQSGHTQHGDVLRASVPDDEIHYRWKPRTVTLCLGSEVHS